MLLNGFETKLDTGEYKFLMQVADVHSDDLTTVDNAPPPTQHARTSAASTPKPMKHLPTDVSTYTAETGIVLDTNTSTSTKRRLKTAAKKEAKETPSGDLGATVPAWLYPAYGAVVVLGFEDDLGVAESETQVIEMRQEALQKRSAEAQGAGAGKNASIDLRVSITECDRGYRQQLGRLPCALLRLRSTVSCDGRERAYRCSGQME